MVEPRIGAVVDPFTVLASVGDVGRLTHEANREVGLSLGEEQRNPGRERRDVLPRAGEERTAEIGLGPDGLAEGEPAPTRTPPTPRPNPLMATTTSHHPLDPEPNHADDPQPGWEPADRCRD